MEYFLKYISHFQVANQEEWCLDGAHNECTNGDMLVLQMEALSRGRVPYDFDANLSLCVSGI